MIMVTWIAFQGRMLLVILADIKFYLGYYSFPWVCMPDLLAMKRLAKTNILDPAE